MQEGQLALAEREAADRAGEDRPGDEAAPDGVAAPPAAADGEGTGGAALPGVGAEFRRLAAPLVAMTRVKPNDPKVLEKLESALRRLPPGEALGQALDELRDHAAGVLHTARRERITAFRPTEAEFVRAAREAGKQLRERANGWRIDMLELQLQREQARARFFYNREPLLPWSPVGSPEALAALEARARATLDRAAWADELAIDVFWAAYEQERARRRAVGGGRAEAVPLPDFYRAVRVALVRHELEGQQPDRKLRWGELPRWAFLYNLDRYRALGAAVPEARRLGLQTGSQQESRGFGMVVNGLDAQQDYKTMSFVVPAAPRAAAS